MSHPFAHRHKAMQLFREVRARARRCTAGVSYATDYEILRHVQATSSAPCAVQPRAKPFRIAILIDEERFRQQGALVHSELVWLEERGHCWDWQGGQLYFYGHAVRPGEKVTLVAVHEETRRHPELVPAQVFSN